MTTRNFYTANITWLMETLATGGDFSYSVTRAGAQLNDLMQQGVGCVIDCRMEADDFDTWMQTDVEYHWLPIDDIAGAHIPAGHFDRAVAIARRAEREGRKVFVHCHMGINRGPSTAFAIMLDRGCDPIKAFDWIRSVRPQAGIAFAEDALWAHLERQGGQVDWSVLDSFVEHRDAVMTPQEQAKIQHKIRQHHELDREERFA